MHKLLIILILSILSFGCSKLPLPHKTFETSEESKSDEILVKGFIGKSGKSLVINHEALLFSCINGQSLIYRSGYGDTSYALPVSILVKPGIHGISASYYAKDYSGLFSYHAYVDLWFEAKKGVQYTLNRKQDGENISIWIEEEGTGKIVSSSSENPPENVSIMYC